VAAIGTAWGAHAVARDRAGGVGGVEEDRGDQPMKSLVFMGAVFAALLLISPSAFAGVYFLDGNKLITEMRETEKAERGEPFNALSDGFFLGFVTGVFDTLDTALCSSGSVSRRQIVAIAMKYLNEHPEQWSQPAYQLVTRALRGAFPCR
jgi:hypothetical protein